MRANMKVLGGVVLLLAIANASAVRAAIAINQITNINNSPGFGGVNVFSNPPIGVDDTAVFMGNDIVVYSLVGGGATGNLVDRVGIGAVVDFLDVGFGTVRWPIFNLADVGVTTGAILLVLLLWDETEPGARAAVE